MIRRSGPIEPISIKEAKYRGLIPLTEFIVPGKRMKTLVDGKCVTIRGDEWCSREVVRRNRAVDDPGRPRPYEIGIDRNVYREAFVVCDKTGRIAVFGVVEKCKVDRRSRDGKKKLLCPIR